MPKLFGLQPINFGLQLCGFQGLVSHFALQIGRCTLLFTQLSVQLRNIRRARVDVNPKLSILQL